MTDTSDQDFNIEVSVAISTIVTVRAASFEEAVAIVNRRDFELPNIDQRWSFDKFSFQYGDQRSEPIVVNGYPL